MPPPTLACTPEPPEVETYLETLRPRIVGQPLERIRIRIRTPSLFRTYDPPVTAIEGRTVAGFHRIGKRIVLESPFDDFAAAITRENRTLKRALTDPRILDGIGGAYSDEILWRARLSPTQRTRNLDPDEVARLRVSR